MPINEEKTKALFQAGSAKYDLGSYDEFKTKIELPEKRKALYETLSKDYDLGSYDEYESKLTSESVKKKNEPEKSEPSTLDSSTASEPLAKSGSVPELSKLAPVNQTSDYQVGDIKGSSTPDKPAIEPITSGLDQVTGKSEDIPSYQKETLAPFGKGIVSGVKSNELARQDAANLAKETKPKLIDIYEKEFEKSQTASPQEEKGYLEKGGELVGGVLEDIVGASAISAIPVVGIPTSIAAIAIKQGAQGAGSEFRRAYIQARTEGKDTEEAYGTAQNASAVGAVTNSIEGALGAITGLGGKYVGKIITEPFKKAIAKLVVDSGVDATVAGTMQVIRNLNDKYNDLKTKWTEGVPETMASEFLMGAGMNAISSIPEIANDIKIQKEEVSKNAIIPKANKVDIENRNTIIAHSPEATQQLVETSIENSPQIVAERLSQNAATATEPITNDAVVEAGTPSVPTEIQAPTEQLAEDVVGVDSNVDGSQPVSDISQQQGTPEAAEGQNTTPISEGIPVSEGVNQSDSQGVGSGVVDNPALKDVEFTAFRFGEEGKDGVTFSSKNKDYSEEYATVKGGKASDVKEVKITAKNPITVDLSPKEFSSPIAEKKHIDEAKKNGNDLVIFRDKENGDEFYAQIEQPKSESLLSKEQSLSTQELTKKSTTGAPESNTEPITRSNEGVSGTDAKEQAKAEPETDNKKAEPKKLKGKDAIAEGIAMFARVSGTTKNIVANDGDSHSNAVKLIAQGIVEELGYTGQKLVDAVKKYLSDAGIDKTQIDTVIAENEDVIKKAHPDPISKFQKSFRIFTDTFNPKEELKTYQKMTGESLSNDAAKLIEEKSPEYVFNALQSIADNKPIAITEDERVHLVAAGALIAQGLDTEHKTLLENNEPEKAQEALDTRNKIVENISYLGTKSGQLIKALDLKWLSSFSDPQSVIDAFSKGLARHITENIDSKSGKVKTYDKIVEKAAKIIVKAKEKSKTEKVDKPKTESEKKEKSESFSTLRGKTKLRGKDLIADASENLVSLWGGIQMLDGGERISLVRELSRVGLGLIDEGLATVDNVHEKIKEHLKNKFGKSDGYENFEKEVNDALFPKSPEEKRVEKLEKELADLESGKEKEPKQKKKSVESAREKELKEQIRAQKEAIKAKKDSETVKEVSEDINSAAKEAEKTTKDFQQKLNKLIDTDEDFKVLHKELMDDLKDLGVKDDKNLNKKAREILALIYLSGKGKDGVVQTAIASAINAKSVNTQAIVQANILVQQATSYPANSTKRSTLMGQALQTIANTQPIDMMQLLLNANYAAMLSRPLTYYSILEGSVIESQAQKNRFSRIPLLGFLTPKGRLLGEINDNKMLGNLAKANLMNAMINGDMRLNSMYSRTIDKNTLSNFMQSSPLERSPFGRVLNAPLRVMGTLDAGFTPFMDKKNEASLIFTSLRSDPNNKDKSDTELLAETKQGLKIFDEQKIAEAKVKATKEGYKEGKLPNFGRMAKNYGNVAIGRSQEAFTQDERDAMDYHIRLNEILEEDKDLEVLDQAENITNKGLMRLGRKFTIDLGNGKTKEVSSPTTYVYEKLEEFNKYLEDRFKQSNNIAGKGAYGTARGLSNLAAPFMKTVMVGISRATDSTPGLGLAKYAIHRGTVGASKNAENTLELQKILHRQYVGALTMGTGILLNSLFEPDDDEEEFKKQPFAFAITGQLTGLDKATKTAWQNKVGKQQLVIFSNGEVVYQLGYQNLNIKMALDANAAIAGFMKQKDAIVKDKGEDYYNNTLSTVGAYVASVGSSLFSSTYNKGMSSFYDTLLEASIEQDGSIITKNLEKTFAATPGNITSLVIPWSGALKQIDGIINGFKVSKDVSSQMWNSFPMTRTIGRVTGNELVKPQLDMFGDPITAYPAIGSNPFTPLGQIYKPVYTPSEKERVMRDHLLFNHAIPSQIKTNQVAIDGETYEIDTEKLTFNTTKKFKDKVFNYKNPTTGDSMYDKIMSKSGNELDDFIDKKFKKILGRERIKLGKQAKEQTKK